MWSKSDFNQAPKCANFILQSTVLVGAHGAHEESGSQKLKSLGKASCKP